MTELDKILKDLVDEEESNCPVCEEGFLKFTHKNFLESEVFECSACGVKIAWFQLSPDEKIKLFMTSVRKMLKTMSRKQVEEFEKRLFVDARY